MQKYGEAVKGRQWKRETSQRQKKNQQNNKHKKDKKLSSPDSNLQCDRPLYVKSAFRLMRHAAADEIGKIIIIKEFFLDIKTLFEAGGA